VFGGDEIHLVGQAARRAGLIEEKWNMTKERLSQIVDFSYERLREKINGGVIGVGNEASLQLQLSAILKATGELFVNKEGETFSIELEKTVSLNQGIFAKSGSERAKIDIVISIREPDGERISCVIELKYFKRENYREPNNRYDVYRDIQNLEAYGDHAHLGYLIVATDHDHYVNKKTYSSNTADFDFTHNRVYTAGVVLSYNTKKPYGKPISLRNSYRFSWDEMPGGMHFLKLSVPLGG
jgi:hypothetical protein